MVELIKNLDISHSKKKYDSNSRQEPVGPNPPLTENYRKTGLPEPEVDSPEPAIWLASRSAKTRWFSEFHRHRGIAFGLARHKIRPCNRPVGKPFASLQE
jgi:hypothetical protein